VGITISAIIVILGSAFTLLGGAMMVFSSAFLSKANPASAVPLNLASIVVIDSVLLSGFGGRGLASGIGLIYLKRWARISTLIFAGFLVCISLPAAAVIALIPKTGANFAVVERIRPKIGICAENLCSSRPIFTRVTSTLQRFCLMNPMQYLLCPGFNKRRTC